MLPSLVALELLRLPIHDRIRRLVAPADARAVRAGTESMTHWIWSIREIRAR